MDSFCGEHLNLRDISTANPSTLRSGVLFRGACPVIASAEEVEVMRRHIAVVIDLRSPDEHEAGGLPFATCAGIRVRYARKRSLVSRKVIVTRSELCAREGSLLPCKGDLTETHFVPLMNRKRYTVSLLKRIPTKAVFHATQLMCKEATAGKRALMGHVNEGGLPFLYQIILGISKPEIACVFRVLLSSLQAGKAVLICCKSGKDRTGIVVMILLAVLKIDERNIITDYHRSDPFGQVSYGTSGSGNMMDKNVFDPAPLDVMQQTLAYVGKRYLSAQDCLAKSGFTSCEQDQLRALLLV